jgi:hypothetical protein
MIGKPVARGFYLVENTENTGVITGPFKKCPDNYDYLTDITEATLINETDNDGVIEYSVKYPETDTQDDPADGGVRTQGDRKTVKLIDQDTGKEYSVVTRAESDDAARLKAVEIIANRTGFHKDRFLPEQPE